MQSKLPLKWTKDTITIGGSSFPAAENLPVLAYPNPLSPSHYVVLNTGLTISDQDYNGDYAMPRFGDIAVLKIKEQSEPPEIAWAALFNLAIAGRQMRLYVTAILLAASAFGAKTLDVHLIDVEGGKALLIVSPSGESMLIDVGWPASPQREASTDRIVEAAKAAGLKQIDYLVIDTTTSIMSATWRR